MIGFATREQWIAHLEIHGWVPVVNRGTDRAGIYNESFGIGFSVRNDEKRIASNGAGDSSVKHWNRSHMRDSYEPCSWDKVTDWHLNIIDARLAET